MSCEDCMKFQDSDVTYYFRWGTATVEIRACEKHIKEIFEVLEKDQNKSLANE